LSAAVVAARPWCRPGGPPPPRLGASTFPLRRLMASEYLQAGDRLRAEYIDGEYYAAEVLAVSDAKKRAKAPVKVRYAGYGEEADAWLPLSSLRSKKLPKEPAPKAKAKAKAAAKKPADDDEDDSDDEPAPKAKAKAKAAAKKPAEDDEDDSDDELAPKAKAKAKAAAKKPADDDDDDDDDDEPAPKAKAKAKAAAKKSADDDDDDDDDEDEPPAKKAKVEDKPKKKIDLDGSTSESLKVFVGGLPYSATEEQIKKDFGECGEITDFHMPKNEEGQPRGIAFITFATQEGLDAALKYDGDDYGGRMLKVNKAGEKGKGKDKGKGKGDKGKGKGDKGKGKGERSNENTVCVRGLPFETTDEAFKKDFEECGEVERCNLLKNEDGRAKGIAFVTYKTEEGFKKALEYNETDYGGRTIYVSQAGEGGKGKDGKGKGKDGKGKDGKGKGKDKGKGKKGKGKGPSESKAKSTGALVESTGVKRTFDDSDDEEEEAPKKAKKAKKPPSDDDEDDE